MNALNAFIEDWFIFGLYNPLRGGGAQVNK